MLVDKNDDVNTNGNQKWTRRTVDKVNNYFIWSNKEGVDNEFLASICTTNLIMKGKVYEVSL